MIAVREWSKFLNDIFQFSCSGVSFILSFPWPCSPGIKMTSYPWFFPHTFFQAIISSNASCALIKYHHKVSHKRSYFLCGHPFWKFFVFLVQLKQWWQEHDVDQKRKICSKIRWEFTWKSRLKHINHWHKSTKTNYHYLFFKILFQKSLKSIRRKVWRMFELNLPFSRLQLHANLDLT